MNKKLMLIGLLLIVAAVAVLLVAASAYGSLQTQLTASSTLATLNLTVSQHNYTAQPIDLNQSYLSSLTYLISSRVNLYIMNATAYLKWRQELSAGARGLAAATSLEKNGITLIAQNISTSQSPQYNASSSGALLFQSDTRPQNDTYYIVLDNTPGSASANTTANAIIIYASTPDANVKRFINAASSINLEGSVPGFIIMVMGIIVLAYGAIKPSNRQQIDVPEKPILAGKKLTPEYIDQLYKDVDKRPSSKNTRRKRKVHRR